MHIIMPVTTSIFDAVLFNNTYQVKKSSKNLQLSAADSYPLMTPQNHPGFTEGYTSV